MSMESQSPDLDLRARLKKLLHSGACDIYRIVISEADRLIIQQVLEFTNGNKAEASRLLGISRFTLRAKLGAAKRYLDRTEIPEHSSVEPGTTSTPLFGRSSHEIDIPQFKPKPHA